MNHIYKTVWSATQGAWVAVSEVAKAHGKSASSQLGAAFPGKLLLLAVAMMGAFSVPAAYAAPGIYINDGTDVGCVGIFDQGINTGLYSLANTVEARVSPNGYGSGSPNVNASQFGVTSTYKPCLSTGTPEQAHDTQTNRTLFYNADWVGASVTNNGAKSLSLGGRLDVNSGIIGVGDRGINGANATNSIRMGGGTSLDDANKKSNAVTIGMDAGASAADATALGSSAKASAASATALGHNAQGTGKNATAIGASASASGEGSFAAGPSAQAIGGASVAIGQSASASSDAGISVAIGQNASANAAWDIAIGRNAGAAPVSIPVSKEGRNIAIGDGALQEASLANNNIALGTGAAHKIDGTANVAIGTYASSHTVKTGGVKVNNSVAVGNRALAQSNNAVAVGARSDANGSESVAIGPSAKTTQNYAIAQGYAAEATGISSIAIGAAQNLPNKTTATSNNSVAIGFAAHSGAEGAVAIGPRTNFDVTTGTTHEQRRKVTGKNSVTVGADSNASAENAIALGKGATASAKDSIAIGTGNTVSGQGSGAFGDPNTVSGTGSYAFGNNNTIAQNNTFVLGNGVSTTQANSVVLGNASADKAATTVASATVGGITYGNFAGQGSAANGVVSVGAVGKERQLIHVAAGEISATSTDAINGSQLHATQTAAGKLAASTAQHFGGNAAVQPDGSISAPTYTINGNSYNNVGAALQAAAASGGGGAGTHYYSVKSTDQNANSNYNNDGAKGSDSLAAGLRVEASRQNGVAIGVDAIAAGSESLAIGNNVKAAALDGSGNVIAATDVKGATAVGNNSRATAEGAQAFGQSSKATAENAAAIGRLATASGTRASAFGVGNTASGASSFSGGDRTVAAGKGAVAIGAWGDAGDPLGNKATQTDAAYSVVIGAAAQANQHSDSAVVIGNQASAAGASAGSTAKDSVAIGYRSAVTTASNIALGSNAKADGNSQATAIGYQSNAKGYQSIAFGSGASAAQTAGGSVALGRETKTTAGNAVAIGNKSEANVGDSVALGSGAATLSSGVGPAPSGSVAIGRGAQTTDRGYALGINARATNESIAIGTNTNYDPATTSAKTIGLSSVAIGNNTNAAGENTVALGNQSTATGSKATALGFDTKAEGQSSVVIGDSAQNKRNTGVGAYPHADQAVAVGVSSNVNSLGGIAIGSTTKATGVYGTAIGIGSQNNADFGVALGALSTTDNAIQVDRAGYVPVASAQASIEATKANAAGISVGGKVLSTQGSGSGQTAVRPAGVSDGDIIRRQIHNVAAGTDDTDAVNVAQLKALSAATTAAKTHYYSVKDDAADAATSDSNYNNDGATGVRSLAAGIWSQATGENATAIGGKNAKATAVQALAVGADTLAEGTSSIAIGGDDLDHLKPTSSATYTALTGDTITVGNYKVTHAKGDAAIAMGVQTEATGDLSMALGTKAEASSVAAVALGTGAKGQAEGAVALGAGSVANRAALAGVTTAPVANATANQVYAPDAAQAADKAAVVATVKGQQGAVSVGNANTTRQITNVAAGSENTDAVNVAQLKAVAARTETTPLTVTNGEVTAPVAGSVDANKLATAGDIANAINSSGFKLTASGANPTLVTPGDTVDLAGDANILVSKGANNNNVAFKLADTVKIGPSTGGNPITINGTAGTISGLNSSLPVTTSTGTPTTTQAAPSPLPAAGNAATVGDVLNAGWNLQTNGTATDFVRPYDTVNFASGNGTTVSSTTDGATTTIKVDVNAQGLAESAQLPVVYTKADGSKVYKHTDGNFYNAPNGGGAQVPTADVIASMQNADGSTTAPTTLANVKAGAKDTDAVNVSQLKGAATALGGGAGVDPNTGAFTAPSYTITKTDGTSYPVANNVGQALQNLNAEVVKPLTFAGDSGTNVERKLGSTVNIKGGAAAAATLTDGNIGVVADSSTNTLNIKLAKDIDLGSTGSVKTGNTTVNNGGVTITGGTNPVSLTAGGLNNGGNKITGVANGVDPTDAVNMSQLNAISNTVNAGWNIGNGGATPVGAVKPGKQVDFVAGNGSTKVDVTHDAGTGNSKVTVSAAPGALQYTDTNQPAGNNTPNADQFTPTNQVTLVGAAGSTGGVTINNVAPAVLTAVSKQAVNGSQLYNTGSSTAAALGGTSSFDPSTGRVTAGLNVGGTTHTSVQAALNAINTTAGSGWNLKANGGAASNIAPNGTVDVVNGSNTKVTLTGNTLKVDVVDAPTFSGQVTANGGLNMAGNVIKNVGAGVAPTDAVNVAQLNAVTNNITNINNLIGPNPINADGTRGTTTYDVGGQTVTNHTGILETINKMNLQGIKYAHTNDNGETPLLPGARTNDSSAAAQGSTAHGVNAIVDATATNATVMGRRSRARAGAVNSVALGNEAVAGQGSAVAIGDGAQALGEKSISIGTGNVVHAARSGAIGDPTTIIAAATDSYSIGNNNTVNTADTFVMGNNVVTNVANSVYLGAGAAATATATAQTAGMTTYNTQAIDGITYNYAGGTPAGVVSVGNVGQERRVQNVAAGLVGPASTDAINGSQLYATNQVVSKLSNGGAGPVQYANAATPTTPNGGTPTNNLTLVGGNTNAPVTLSNVAPGEVSPTSTQAVNGSQLYQVTNAAYGGLANQVNRNHDKAMGGIASAMASAGLPQAYLPGKSMIAMGVGAYQGRSAVAVGVSTISDNGHWVIKGSVNANNKGNVGATIGAGYQW